MNKSPFKTDVIIGSLVKLFEHQKNIEVTKILRTAKAEIKQTDYDSWDEGTFIYTLYLYVPLELFAEIEEQVSAYREMIASKVQMFPVKDNDWLKNVIIYPQTIEEPDAVPHTDVDLRRIWGNDSTVRLFISHKSAHKSSATELKSYLKKLGISAFVAHEDIAPSHLWRYEIKLALQTMDVFTALLTPDYHDSEWTDQEIGFALARNIPQLYIRCGLKLYGFLEERQALTCSIENHEEIGNAVFMFLNREDKIAHKMREALFYALESSNSYGMTTQVLKRIEALDNISHVEMERIKKAAKSNSQVGGLGNIQKRIDKLETKADPF